MPRTPIDFSKTIIYKIVHKEDPDNHESYVGHTTNFTNRKREHKSCCNNPNSNDFKHMKYQYIRENGGWESFIMLEIEKYPCNDANEARAREQEWYNELKSKLNQRFPKRSRNEWYEANRREILNNNDIYYKKNRNKFLEYQKKYREDNPDKVLEYNKQYRKDNLDKIYNKQNEKIKCEICGFIGGKQNILRHQKSKKCTEAKK